MEVTQLFLPSYVVHTSVTHIREGYCQKPVDQLMSEVSIMHKLSYGYSLRVIGIGVNLHLIFRHIKEMQ